MTQQKWRGRIFPANKINVSSSFSKKVHCFYFENVISHVMWDGHLNVMSQGVQNHLEYIPFHSRFFVFFLLLCYIYFLVPHLSLLTKINFKIPPNPFWRFHLCCVCRTSLAVITHPAWQPSAKATRRCQKVMSKRWQLRSSKWAQCLWASTPRSHPSSSTAEVSDRLQLFMTSVKALRFWK